MQRVAPAAGVLNLSSPLSPFPSPPRSQMAESSATPAAGGRTAWKPTFWISSPSRWTHAAPTGVFDAEERAGTEDLPRDRSSRRRGGRGRGGGRVGAPGDDRNRAGRPVRRTAVFPALPGDGHRLPRGLDGSVRSLR